MDIWRCSAIILLISASAFFSASEIAFNSLNKLRLRKMSEQGSRLAALVLKTSENFTSALSAILIGNNLVNIAASSIATLIVIDIFAGYNIENSGLSSAVSTAAMTILLLIFGEITPKIIARRNAEGFAKIAVAPVRILTFIFYPLIGTVLLIIKGISILWKTNVEMPTITGEELSSIIDTVEQEGVIDEEKSDLLQSTIEFSDTTVNEIITPRIDMLSIDIDDDTSYIMKTINESRYTRIPVYEDNIDNIIGILNLNKFYRLLAEGVIDEGKPDFRSVLTEPVFLHKTAKLPGALSEMRTLKCHAAIVVDEYGGTLGLVTMEDILEEIVGDIWDETDEIVADFSRTGDNSYEVSGDMGIYDFLDAIGIDSRDIDSEYTTVGGWSIEQLKSDPHEGDSFTYKNLYVIVTTMDDLRIKKLSVVKNPEPEGE